ncbi:MAG: flagellin [Alphaproteobacteria bacterium]
MTRVATLSAQNLSLALLQQTKSRIMDAQVQISTGKKAERYMGVAADSARLVSLKADHARVTQFMAGNRVTEMRLQRMETSVAGMMDVASNLRTLLVSATQAGNAGVLALPEAAGAMLSQVGNYLNIQLDGRHLFAGDRTDTPPVDFSTLPTDGVFAGDAADLYYRGDDARASVRTGESSTLTYGVTAADPAFDRLVKALQIVATVDTSDPAAARDRLEEALELAIGSISAISDVRSRIGSALSTIELANTQHDEFLLYAEGAIGDLENVDVTEAITRLSGHQATIEASYASLARLQSVSLVDYLR